MKTVYTHFSNHFDLVWRRCWDRDYEYPGGKYASYRRIEELCLLHNIELAEQGEGAYAVEQTLTMRAFLETHPEALPAIKSLYAKGLFEMYGAGEAIIDVNMCSGETMCRNLASGVRYCHDVLEMPPLLANHNDGFGSSAQFPQVMRGCGLPGIQGMSYSVPDNQYWRGLDGTTVLVWAGAPGKVYFYDHCYHEPCRVCRNLTPADCPACRGTGLDMPQNTFPPFEPTPSDQFAGDLSMYQVCSEEMLSPTHFSAHFRHWESKNPEVAYHWGTPRMLAEVWEPLAKDVDNASPDRISSGVENNPVQTGCLVSRIRIKQMARQLESAFYGWEKAVMLTPQAAGELDRQRWETFFLELPLMFFHDSITGTHQDLAYEELIERMVACRVSLEAEARRVLGGSAGANDRVSVFMPHASALPACAELPLADWRSASPLVAVDDSGGRHPVVVPIHAFSPVVPLVTGRLVNSVGSDARTRPDQTRPRIELRQAAPLTWTQLRLEAASAPVTLAGRTLGNGLLEVALGDDGVESVHDLQTGLRADAGELSVGELLLEEDEGDPWGTRKLSAFRSGMRTYTKYLGAAQFEGYQEAWYYGRFEPNIRFGREADPKVFSLEWMTTVRLLEGARRVDFSFEVFWKSSDRRVRIAFPVNAPSDTGVYSIPAGWLRRERYEQTETCLWSPNGDWPALHFVGAEPNDSGHGWAVVNHGTPAARIEDGTILVSVLRSPGFGHCLERYAQSYPMPTSGIRDGGWHHFSFNLMPYKDVATLALEAAALNQAAPCLAGTCPTAGDWAVEGAGIELQSVKPAFDAEDRDAVVLRLVNQSAEPSVAKVRIPLGHTASSGNLIEEPEVDLGVVDGKFSLQLRPFEIRSVMVGTR